MGFFSRLFGKKEQQLADFSQFGVDFHSHLVPGIDDGSKSLDESVELVTALQIMGFSRIITSPHIFPGTYNNTPEIIRSGVTALNEELSARSIDMIVEPAAEYYIDETFMDKVESGDLLTFGSNYLLFEFSFVFMPPNFAELAFQLNSKGIKPILAHPERYPFLHSPKLEKYRKLKDAGVYFQLNIASLTGHYSKQVKKIAEKLITDEMIDFVATDMHHKGHIEVLNQALFSPYLKQLANNEYLLNQTLLNDRK